MSEIDVLLHDVNKNREDGKVLFATIDGVMSANLAEFITQPADGILYDLNRDEVTTASFGITTRTINDLAVATVIRYLRAELARRDAVIEQLIFDHKIAVAERERLTAELVEKGEYENKLVNPVESMLEEIEKLQSIIDDYREGIAKTLEERCPSDERHCGCVPILRQEIDRLKNEKDNRGWWES